MLKIGVSVFTTVGFIVFVFLITMNNGYSWTIEHDFESGNVGTGSTMISKPGVDIGAQGHTYFSNTQSHSGAQSAQLNIEGPTAAELADPSLDRGRFGTWGARWLFPQDIGQGDEIWVRLSVFFPINFDFTTDFALKFLRFHVSAADGKHLGYTDIYINNDLSYKYQNELFTTHSLILSTEDFSGSFRVGETIVGRTSGAIAIVTAIKADKSLVYESRSGQIERYEWVDGRKSGASAIVTQLTSNSVIGFGKNDPVTRGKWETVYYNVRYGSKLSSVKFWKVVNGEIKLLFSDYTDKTLKNPGDKVDAFLLFTYWNGGASKTQSMYVDDIWLSTERPPEMNPPKSPVQN